jgi:arabinogalactan oligomer/maltooligosaccharide transport system substrate-binding protein
MYDISGVPGLANDPHLMGIQEQAPYSDPMPTIPEVNMMWGPLATLFIHSWNGTLSIPETQALAMEEYRNLLAIAGLTLP